jgi:beta-galactosidase
MKRFSLILVIMVSSMFIGQNTSALAAENGGDMKSDTINVTSGREIINFDKDWKFQREDDDMAMKDPGFNDKKWKKLNVPHDWAIEGHIKPKKVKYDVPVLRVVEGQWMFNKGDDMAWKAVDFDDSKWQKVKLPSTWEEHSNYKGENSFGWYRRDIMVPASMKGKDIIISCGMIDDVDETYFNGELVGSMGTLPPKYDSKWNTFREYRVKSSLIKYGKKNRIAVRVYNGSGAAGIWADRPQSVVEGPFDKSTDGGSANGFLPGGIGWYRKTFTVPEELKGKNITIEFDGAYMDTETWLNGISLGKHPYGYTSFSFDLTPYLKYGKEENMLAMRLDVLQQCTRWYSGAGIYRHVRLVAVEPVHIAKWGTYITTPDISDNEAKVNIETRIENTGSTETSFTLETMVFDRNNSVCAKTESNETVGGNSGKIISQEIQVQKPLLWSTEEPNLYSAISRVIVNNEEKDRYTSTFGIREIKFTIDGGFFMNGRHVPIRGVCLHHDQGYLGTAVHRRTIERQIQIMKAMGCNAIRTSHNPPEPMLLEYCDRLGMMVMDEAFDEWKENKTSHGYGRFFDEWAERDITSMLRRDRNHPSIIIWSIGNEIAEQWTGTAEDAEARAKLLAGICHKEDPTRPVTSACNNVEQALQKGIGEQLDVFGINYNPWAYRKEQGARKLIGTETASDVSTRGEYNLVEEDGKVFSEPKLNTQCSSYDNFAPEWATIAWQSLKALKEAPWVAGEFVWTGFDYIGEPTPYWWPAVISYFGIVDLCGFPKDRYYLYQSQWTDKPMVHVLPHWNWKKFEGKEIPVYVYSNCDTVELFLNGKTLGEQSVKDAAELRLKWDVPYRAGELIAVAKKDGKEVCRDTVKTAGRPAKIELVPDRAEISADGEDLSYVTVRILDSKGNMCPDADNLIKFTIEGKGKIAATGNGNSINHAFFNAQAVKAFHGMGLAIVEASDAPSMLVMTAQSAGLRSAEINIKTK